MKLINDKTSFTTVYFNRGRPHFLGGKIFKHILAQCANLAYGLNELNADEWTVDKIEHPPTGGVCYLMWRLLDKKLVISFRGRGSVNIECGCLPCADGLNFDQEKMANCLNTVFVHQGFQSQYLALRDEVRYVSKKHFDNHPPKQLIIIGHSFGGALATLCAIDFSINTITTNEGLSMPSDQDLLTKK